ncbi:MAG: hypothetical protein SH850_22125 [Planctomycetaceae bacterium]|nr:hypothetical protein [Planctomycetaceae bacterium]
MKATPLSIALVLAGTVLGAVLTASVGQPVAAQVATATAPNVVSFNPGTFQVSSYAAQQGAGTFGHGCYVINTTTGELWHARSGGKTEKVSARLP